MPATTMILRFWHPAWTPRPVHLGVVHPASGVSGAPEQRLELALLICNLKLHQEGELFFWVAVRHHVRGLEVAFGPDLRVRLTRLPDQSRPSPKTIAAAQHISSSFFLPSVDLVSYFNLPSLVHREPDQFRGPALRTHVLNLWHEVL